MWGWRLAEGIAIVVSACTPFEAGSDRASFEMATTDNRPETNGGLGAAGSPMSDGISMSNPWHCLDELDNPGLDDAESGSTGDSVALRVSYHNYANQSLIASGLQMRVCNTAEVDCANPVVDWQALPASGLFTALVPWGFNGFLEVEAEGFMPHITIIDTPVYRDLQLYSQTLLPLAVYQGLGEVLNTPIDSGRSLLTATVTDCNGNLAKDVRVEMNLEDSGISYVTSQGVPTLNENVSQRDGAVGYGNVPAGLARLSAYAPDGRLFDQQGVLLRAGTQTVAYLRPRIWSTEEICGVDGARPLPGTIQSAGLLEPCERQ